MGQAEGDRRNASLFFCKREHRKQDYAEGLYHPPTTTGKRPVCPRFPRNDGLERDGLMSEVKLRLPKE
jgi:hypothetical protein